MDVYYQVKQIFQALKLDRKFDISHWLACGAVGRVVGHMVMGLPKFLGWIDYQIFLGKKKTDKIFEMGYVKLFVCHILSF